MEGKRNIFVEPSRWKPFTQMDAAKFLTVPLRTYEGWECDSRPREPAAMCKVWVLRKIARTYRIRKRGKYV